MEKIFLYIDRLRRTAATLPGSQSLIRMATPGPTRWATSQRPGSCSKFGAKPPISQFPKITKNNYFSRSPSVHKLVDTSNGGEDGGPTWAEGRWNFSVTSRGAQANSEKVFPTYTGIPYEKKRSLISIIFSRYICSSWQTSAPPSPSLLPRRPSPTPNQSTPPP